MKKSKRHQAFSINLGEGAGEVKLMCSIGKCLEVFTSTGIYQVYPPESLDPAETNPDMPGLAKRVSSYGTKKRIVARVMIQNYNLVSTHALHKEDEKSEFALRLHELMEALILCNECSEYFWKRVEEIEEKVIQEGLTPNQNIFEDFPTTEGIEEKITTFLTKAKHSIQRVIDIFNIFHDTKISNPRIDKLIEWTEKRENLSAVTDCLKRFEPVSKQFVDLRNYQEHPSTKKRFEYTDFTILPTNEISAPLWGINQSKSSIHKEMAFFIREFVAFSEWLFIYLVLCEKTDNPVFGYQVIEIPNDQRDSLCPVKYSIEIRKKDEGEQGASHNERKRSS